MKRRAKATIAILLTVLALLIVLRKPIQRRATESFLLMNDSPSENAMDAAVDASPDPADLLIRFWNSRKLPQREYAMQYFQSNRALCDANWPRLRPIALEAIRTRDLDMQQPAMAILARHEPAQAAAAAAQLCDDADPDVRLLGLRTLADVRDDRYLPLVVDHLNDADRNVAAFVPSALEMWTGHASGGDTRPSAPPATKPWALPASDISTVDPLDMQAVDFAFTDTAGKNSHLSDLRGKPVVVNFFATWCGPCVAEMPTLVQLQARHPNDLVILGVCVDAIPDDDGDAKRVDPTQPLLGLMDKNKINYRMTIDRAGKATAAYAATGVPITVVIDAQGRVRRRMLGPRPIEALDRMIAEISR